ncbi:Nitrate reductase cytochrome c-type subunit (NapB) [Symmachiella macrocystis]|uniref:Nitrate reductase cytochrome c-type subunit (NapB) n=1 Tax=Symmachiella macrocystis TaxID=2527985 RepID=A0A5C6BI41_9PLAN|nr:Nitrate reductase cytochrome c-type subunit (NapB) [Symmachiella macrocystis]
MNVDPKSNTVMLIALVVISLAVAGYFTGLQSPMNAPETPPPLRVNDGSIESLSTAEPGVIPATHYAEMAQATFKRRSQTLLSGLKSSVDPAEKITIKPEDKLVALRQRDANRAFNGAPPTIPHSIDQISDASCVACHSVGAKTQSLRIPSMSHQLLSNCTQCHVESSSRHANPIHFRENRFDGVKAPQQGPRSFPGAPPQIPHTTWMRSNCKSCHGYVGLQGIRTTHPWRNNCLQCHAPSADSDQTFLVTKPQFLQGPNIEDKGPHGKR